MATNGFGVETGNQSTVNQNMSRDTGSSGGSSPFSPNNFTPANPGNYTPGQPAPSGGGGSSGGSSGGGGSSRRRRNDTPPDITNPLPDLTPVQTPVSATATPVREELSRVSMIGGMSVDPNQGVVPIASTVGGNTRYIDRASNSAFDVGPTAQPTPFSPTNQVPMSVAPVNPFWTNRSPYASYADGGSWESDAKAESQTYALETDRSWWQRRSQEAAERANRVRVIDPTPEFGTGTLTEYKPSAWEKYVPAPLRGIPSNLWQGFTFNPDGDLRLKSGVDATAFMAGYVGGVATLGWGASTKGVTTSATMFKTSPNAIKALRWVGTQGERIGVSYNEWKLGIQELPGIKNVVQSVAKSPKWVQNTVKGAQGLGKAYVARETIYAGTNVIDSIKDSNTDSTYALTQDQIAALRKVGYEGQNAANTGVGGFMANVGADWINPMIGRSTKKGSQGFNQAVVDELKLQGYNQNDAAVIAARVMRGSDRFETGEALALIYDNKISEGTGRFVLSNSLAKKGGTLYARFGYVQAGIFAAKRIAVAGAQEGANVYLSQQRFRNEKVTPTGLVVYTALGAVSAGTVGGVVAGAPLAKNPRIRALGSSVNVVANTIDPFEKPGDLLADVSQRWTKKAGGRVPLETYGYRAKIGTLSPVLTQTKTERGGFTSVNTIMNDISSNIQQSKSRKGKIFSFINVESQLDTKPNSKTPTPSWAKTLTSTKTRTNTKTLTSTNLFVQALVEQPVQVPSNIKTPTDVQVNVPVTIPRGFLPIPPLGSGFSGAFGGKGGKSKKGASKSVFAAFFNLKGGFNQAKYGAEQTGIVLRS